MFRPVYFSNTFMSHTYLYLKLNGILHYTTAYTYKALLNYKAMGLHINYGSEGEGIVGLLILMPRNRTVRTSVF